MTCHTCIWEAPNWILHWVPDNLTVYVEFPQTFHANVRIMTWNRSYSSLCNSFQFSIHNCLLFAAYRKWLGWLWKEPLKEGPEQVGVSHFSLDMVFFRSFRIWLRGVHNMLREKPSSMFMLLRCNSVSYPFPKKILHTFKFLIQGTGVMKLAVLT
jgi:hypothetical protein